MSGFVYRGASPTSLVFHVPSGNDPTLSACSGLPLWLEDPIEIDFAAQAQSLCRRRACAGDEPRQHDPVEAHRLFGAKALQADQDWENLRAEHQANLDAARALVIRLHSEVEALELDLNEADEDETMTAPLGDDITSFSRSDGSLKRCLRALGGAMLELQVTNKRLQQLEGTSRRLQDPSERR